MKRKSLKLLSLLLIVAVFLTACGQAADKGGEIVEPEEVEVVEEEPVEENVEKLDFEGRQMNVVTTSEKYEEIGRASCRERV